MRAAVLVFACVAAAVSAAEWKIIDSNIATIDTGLAFTSDTVGYTGGAANGVGPEIFKTVDGGKTWTVCPAKFGADLLLLDTDAADNTIVISSIFGELYSTDAGASFQASTGGGTSQSVRYIGTDGDGGLKFGVTGQYGLFTSVNGVGISVDGGKTFKAYDANMQTDARYGAFPTDTTWYVAGGTWPGEGSDDQPVDDQPVDGKAPLHKKYVYNGRSLVRQKPRHPLAAAPNGYQAQITKTADGGATFTSVFNTSNEFYFNAIDCLPGNANWCCAVGEADNDSPAPGARVHCTQDGGSTWTRTFYAPGNSTTGFSLIEIRFLSDKEGWAVGGVLNAIYPSSWFIKTLDGGQTWTADPTVLPGYYAMGLSNVDDTHAWSSLLNPLTQESSIAEYN